MSAKKIDGEPQDGEPQGVAGGAGDRQHRKERAGEILDVALRLFSEKGYTNVTLRDIARHGRINSALVYYYYHNKEDLFVAAVKHAVNKALAGGRVYSPAEASADPITQIEMWFEANEKLAKPLSQMLRLMLEFRSTGRRSTSLQRLIARFYEAEMSMLSRAIDQGMALGCFRAVNVAETALFISTHLDGLMVAATIRSDIDLKRALHQLQEVLFRYLGVENTARATGVSRVRRGAVTTKAN
jgi:AcrR family transcriptional regulator